MEKTSNNLYRMRHILVTPQFTDEELLECDLLLDSLANQIRQGTITFEDAALKYSDDKYTKQNGGLMTNNELMEMYGNMGERNAALRTVFYREELFDDYDAIRSMKPGDVSNSFRGYDLRRNVLSKMVKLLQIIPSHTANLKDDYLAIEQLALSDKQNKEFEKWLEQKISAMYIRIAPEWREGEFVNKSWVK
jgi:peptidyl-prolyl cis-trans isomerase SurA